MHERFDKYKGAETIGEAMSKGANWQDLPGDFAKSFMSLPMFMDCDEANQGGMKRVAPEGTPDREASARSRTPGRRHGAQSIERLF